MNLYDRTHLDYDGLQLSFSTHAAQESGALAALLADIAEIDTRHDFLRAGFESMRAYCMHKLHLTEDAAARRVQVARLARDLPALFPAIAAGRLHMGAVLVLSARLTRANVDEWIALAAGKTVREIDVLLAHRFPQPEPMRLDHGIDPQVVVRQPYREIGPQVVVPQRPDEIPHATMRAELGAAVPPAPPKVRSKVTPLSPNRYNVLLSLDQAGHDKLCRAQDMLSHLVPSGNPSEIFVHALDALLSERGKRKFGLDTKAREARVVGTLRSIPSQIRNAVYKRDGGRCVFVHKDGRGCGSTRRLEFDHVVPLAQGGKTTVENLRLLCRAHNQYEAERAFGREFMDAKRRTAR
jgi:hypothetical protein